MGRSKIVALFIKYENQLVDVLIKSFGLSGLKFFVSAWGYMTYILQLEGTC